MNNTSFLWHHKADFETLCPAKTMADELQYIPNDTTQNYHVCKLQLVGKTYGHLT